MTGRQRLVWTVSALVGAASLALFARFWFDPRRVEDATGVVPRWVTVVLFVLLTLVVWHRVAMDTLGHVLSRRMGPASRVAGPPPVGLKAAFITTFVPGSEPLSMLRATLTAMVAADYDHDTWVLDEGDEAGARALCRELGVKHFSRKGMALYNQPDGRFAARTKGGNHNAWYDAHGHAYDVVAQIDTDFIARRDFLTKTLGYFRDARTGWVVTPQIYGNTDSLVARGAAQQQFTFYGPLLRALSARGSALLLGANHVIRVSALKSVDWYEGHITEDLATGIKMHAAGWRSYYVPLPLAVGEGPTSWPAYFSQQARWAYGCFAVLFQVTPRVLRKLGWRRSVVYLWLQQNYFSGLAFVVGALLIAGYLITGVAPASMPLLPLLSAYLPYLIWRQAHSFWMQRFNVRQEEKGWQWAGRLVGTVVQPVYALALVYLLIGRRLAFKVTPKGEGQAPITPLVVFRQHLVIAAGLTAALLAGGLELGHLAWPMVAWALVTTVAMLVVPLVEVPARVDVFLSSVRASMAAASTRGRHRPATVTRRLALSGATGSVGGTVVSLDDARAALSMVRTPIAEERMAG